MSDGGQPRSDVAELASDAEDLLSTPQAGPAAVRGGSLRIGAFFAGSLLSVLAAAALYRHLGPVEGGRYGVAVAMAAVVTGFTDLGLTAVGIRELAVLKGEQRRRVARSLLGIRLAVTVLGVIAISVFAGIAYGGLLTAAVVIAGLGVLVTNTQSTLSVPLMSELRLGSVSGLELGRQVVAALMTIAFVVAGLGLLPFLTTPAIGAAVALVPTAMLVRGDIPLRPSFSFGEWRSLLAPVVTYSIAVAAATLYFRVAIVLVSLIAPAHQVGYYSISLRVIEVLITVPGLLVGAAFPIFARAARDDPARLGYGLSRVFEVSLIVGVWLSLSLAVGARLAIDIVGGSAYLPATTILAILGLGLGATFVSTVWGYGMLSLHLHRLILLFSLASLVVSVVVMSVLVSVDGARGGAIGTAAVEIGVAIAGGLLLVRGRPHLRPRLAVVPKVALAAALGATMMLATGLPVIVRLVLSSAIYIAVVLALRAIPTEAYDLVPARLRRSA